MKLHHVNWKEKDLKRRFSADLPEICHVAIESESVETFKNRLVACCHHETITRLCAYDGQTIRDFATEKEVAIDTI